MSICQQKPYIKTTMNQSILQKWAPQVFCQCFCSPMFCVGGLSAIFFSLVMSSGEETPEATLVTALAAASCCCGMLLFGHRFSCVLYVPSLSSSSCLLLSFSFSFSLFVFFLSWWSLLLLILKHNKTTNSMAICHQVSALWRARTNVTNIDRYKWYEYMYSNTFRLSLIHYSQLLAKLLRGRFLDSCLIMYNMPLHALFNL